MNNAQDDNPFQTKNLPTANEAFGNNMNEDDDDGGVPFLKLFFAN